MAYEKLVTCCYCGTRAALVLRGDVRHELSCSTCGAPISQMKHLKKPVSEVKSKAKAPKPVKKSKKKKRKSFDLFDEVFDFLEDMFD